MAELDAKEREDLPKKDFALPKDRSDTGGEGGYPIPDEAHAKAALAYSKRFASPEEQAKIRAKVKAKFPDMDVEGPSEDKKEDEPKEKKAKMPMHEWLHSPARMREKKAEK